MWCATLNGNVLQYDATSFAPLSSFELHKQIEHCTLFSLLVVHETLWFVCLCI